MRRGHVLSVDQLVIRLSTLEGMWFVREDLGLVTQT